MSRRCRPLFAAAVAAVVLAPAAGAAQTPDAGQWPYSGTLPPNTSSGAAPQKFGSGTLPPNTGSGETPDIGATPPPQNPDNGDLLQPSLDGNPANKPKFRRPNEIESQPPPTGLFTAPSRIGATPSYGSPQGFGAGDTGFDSMNLSRSEKKKLQSKAPAPPAPGVMTPAPDTTFEPVPSTQFGTPTPPTAQQQPPPAPEINPRKASTRPGATLPALPQPVPLSNPPPEVYPLPASTRPGASPPLPPALDAEETARDGLFDANASASTPPPGTQPMNTYPLGTIPQRPLPLAEGDAYGPIGIQGGSFMFFPSVDLSAAYDTNPQHIPGGAGSAYFIVAPELKVESLWSRHSLTADISGNYTDYTNDGNYQPKLSRPYFNSKIDGRIDVTRDTQILLENRVIVTTLNPGNPNMAANLATIPLQTTVGGTAGLSQDLGRLNLTFSGAIDRNTLADSKLIDGDSFSNVASNYNQYAAIARATYDINSELKPFVELEADTRVHDDQFDPNGQQRDSDGTSAKFGATLAMTNSLTGQMAVGYVERTYQDPNLPPISGPTIDGALIWEATPLTTAKITATSIVNESVLENVSGSLSRDLTLEVDHALRRWLIANVMAGYGNDDYVGLGRNDNRYYVAGGLTYALNREIQLKTELRHDWLTSNFSGVAYDSTSILLGAHLQR